MGSVEERLNKGGYEVGEKGEHHPNNGLSEYAFGAVDFAFIPGGGDHHEPSNHNGDEGEGGDEQGEHIDHTEDEGGCYGRVIFFCVVLNVLVNFGAFIGAVVVGIDVQDLGNVKTAVAIIRKGKRRMQ